MRQASYRTKSRLSSSASRIVELAAALAGAAAVLVNGAGPGAGALPVRAAVVLAGAAALGAAQDAEQAAPISDPKQRAKAVRDYAKQGGPDAIATLKKFLTDPDIGVRQEAVKGIVQIGTQNSLDPLEQALRDNDPEIQIRATDGLVNFYLPGYIQSGITATLKRAGGSIVSRFSGSGDDAIIPAYVEVRPDVIQGISELVSGGASMDSRSNAARALGILRGKAAVGKLVEALHTHDEDVIYESLIALDKINDPSAGPGAAFLVGDFNKRIQIAALDLEGVLRNQGALPRIRDVFSRAKDKKVRVSALEAIASMPEAQDSKLLEGRVKDKDPDIRAAALEGLGRLGEAGSQAQVHAQFEDETKPAPRMAAAFSDALLGNLDMSEFAPLRYLVNQLNSAAWRGVTLAYLVELARQPKVREALYPALSGSLPTREEKTGLAQVLAASGGKDSIPYADKLSRDRDTDVASAGLDALRTLKSRFP